MNNTSRGTGRATIGLFRTALRSLNEWIVEDTSHWNKLALGPHVTRHDILGLVIEEGEAHPGSLFDHDVGGRTFLLSRTLLDGYESLWERQNASRSQRSLMAELFLLHELKHIPQGVASATYAIAGSSAADFFARLDYAADAYAIDICYERHARPSPSLDTELLVQIFEALFVAAYVFVSVDRHALTACRSERWSPLEGSRIRRQLVWGLQLARARAFPAEQGFAAFELHRALDLRLFPSTNEGPAADLCDLPKLTPDTIVVPFMLNILISNFKQFDHPVVNPREGQALNELLFEGNLAAASGAFRSLLSVQDWLVGRGAEAQLPFEPTLGRFDLSRVKACALESPAIRFVTANRVAVPAHWHDRPQLPVRSEHRLSIDLLSIRREHRRVVRDVVVLSEGVRGIALLRPSPLSMSTIDAVDQVIIPEGPGSLRLTAIGAEQSVLVLCVPAELPQATRALLIESAKGYLAQSVLDTLWVEILSLSEPVLVLKHTVDVVEA